jgi:hypothetical protein
MALRNFCIAGFTKPLNYGENMCSWRENNFGNRDADILTTNLYVVE